MSAASIGELFRIQTRFLRSAQLERDFEDASALDGYVLTPQLSEHLDRIFAGLAPNSGQRAWRITGDYGVGKSSFALLLTHFLAGQSRGLPKQLRGALPNHKPQRSLLPVLVTGSREPVAVALLRAVRRSLEQLHSRRVRVFEHIDQLLSAAPKRTDDNAVIQVIQEVRGVRFRYNGSEGLPDRSRRARQVPARIFSSESRTSRMSTFCSCSAKRLRAVEKRQSLSSGSCTKHSTSTRIDLRTQLRGNGRR